MNKISITNDIASTYLGKQTKGSITYDPSLLVAIPRFENREKYQIFDNELPFDGWDVWHCYEFSVLTENNLPITRVLKLKYSAESKYIVESKSLKLYLNSFNMTNIGENSEQCLLKCKELIQKDLNKKLQTEVYVSFLDEKSFKNTIFSDYTNILNSCNEQEIRIENFNESPQLLKINNIKETKENRLYFDSLRSNCRVTHQPDFGDIFIYYKSQKHIEESSLVKYLVSFRNEYHFHEECCEMIFKRLSDILNPEDELMVCALYTRRGGIDISPVRYKGKLKDKDIENILDIDALARFGIKQ